MASKYYTPPVQPRDGDTAYVKDVNDINDETDSAFVSVEGDVEALSTAVGEVVEKSKDWAVGPDEDPSQEVEPGLYSSKKYALDSDESAVESSNSSDESASSAIEATDQATIATAKATEASDSASTANMQAMIANANAIESGRQATVATEQATIATAQAIEATTQATTATEQATIATEQATIATAQKDIVIAEGDTQVARVIDEGNTQEARLEVIEDELVKQTSPTGAMVIPSGTTAERPANPLVNYLRYNTTLSVKEEWNGTEWVEFSGGGGGGEGTPPPKVETADFTATLGEWNHQIDLTGLDSLTVTFPEHDASSDNNLIFIQDLLGICTDQYPIYIVATNGELIEGADDVFKVNRSNISLVWQWVGGAVGWKITNGIGAEGAEEGTQGAVLIVPSNYVYVGDEPDTVITDGNLPDTITKATRYVLTNPFKGKCIVLAEIQTAQSGKWSEYLPSGNTSYLGFRGYHTEDNNIVIQTAVTFLYYGASQYFGLLSTGDGTGTYYASAPCRVWCFPQKLTGGNS